MTEDDSSPAEEAGEFEKAFADAVNAKTASPEDDQKPASEPADAPKGAEDDQPKREAEPPRAKSWKEAPEEWRQVFEQEIEHRKRSDENRIAAYQRQIAELKAQTPAPAAGDKPQPSDQKPEGEKAARGDRFKQVREDFPDLADPFIEEIAELRQEVERVREVANNIKALDEQQQQEALAANDEALLQKHPDFYDTLKERSKEFNDWLQTEAPAKFGAIVQANRQGIYDPIGASSVFEAFKAFIGSPTEPPNPSADRRSRQLRGAAAPSSGGGPRPGNLHPETGDFDAHFSRFAAAKEKELRAAL